MSIVCKRIVLLGMVILSAAPDGRAQTAAQPIRKSILFLSWYQADLPVNTLAVRAMQEELQQVTDLSLNIYYEYFDNNRFNEAEYQRKVFDLYAHKYCDKSIDLVIVINVSMLNLWLAERPAILPNTPVICYDATTTRFVELDLPSDVIGVATDVDFTQSVRWFLQVHPSVDEIVLVHGSGPTDRVFQHYIGTVQTELCNGKLHCTDWSSLPFSDIARRAAILPDTSVILYTLLFEDAAGVRYKPIDALRQLAATASVPVLSGYDQFIGTGTIGGSMYSIEEQSRIATHIGLRLLRGEAVSDVSVMTNQGTRFIFDHLALQRWNIPLSSLPPDSIIKNRQYSAWELYRLQIIGIVIGFSLLLLLSAFLARQTQQLRKARSALTGLNVNLETQVRERTAELRIAKEHADEARKNAEAARRTSEAANQAKSVFLANMSHELRTPLNGILGFVQILQRDRALTPQQAEGMKIIEHSGHHLLALINDILDLAKVESGKLELSPVEFYLPGLLAGIDNIIHIRAEEKGIVFRLETPGPSQEGGLPTYVHGDERRLRQVLLNLLGNAVKFTEVGAVVLRIGTPLVDVQTLDGQAQGIAAPTRLKFEISDTGIGITPEDLENIFQPFQQTGEQKYRQQGTGLGLAICRNLIASMGGELQVQSRIGQGSTFWFEIPLLEVRAEVDRPSRAAREIVGIKGTPPIILVVDDQPDNRRLVMELLSPLGCRMLEAGNGLEGLQQALNSHPDLIITDIRMPVMDGLELIRRVRQAPELRDTIVITSSASVYAEDQQSCIEAGSQVFLPKPVEAARLFEQLDALLGIEWVYEDEGNDAAAPGESVMILPSEAELEAMERSALIGDILTLRKMLATFERRDSRLLSFVTALRPLMQGFQMDDIRAFLENSRLSMGPKSPAVKQEMPPSRHVPRLAEGDIVAALSDLRVDLLHALEKACLEGDVEAIEQLIDLIRNEKSALADALEALTAEFDYSTIVKYIQDTHREM